MDAERYGRVRDLFLAAEELPESEQHAYVNSQAGEDRELAEEVLSLLREHDPESARREGESKIAFPRRGPQSVAAGGNGDGSRVAAHAADPRASQPSEHEPHRSQITRQGAQRTHASPRANKPLAIAKPTSSSLLWAQRTRQSRRRTSSWLWLAALLPTALIGWWTYRQVERTIRQSVANELQGVADSVGLASQRFLADKAQLVQSWSRQPAVQQTIASLAESANGSSPSGEGDEVASERIRSQLQQLSGYQDVKFAVWNDSYRTIASWQTDEIGKPVDPDRAGDLARVMSGETVVLGPRRMPEPDMPEPDMPEPDMPEPGGTSNVDEQPMMAIIVPVRDPQEHVIASMMVHGIEMYREFNRMFMNVALAGDLDAYAINGRGIMLTDSPRALAMSASGQLEVSRDEIAASLRVADPGFELTEDNRHEFDRSVAPLTIAVAAASTGSSNVRVDPYANYAGQRVVGAWRWYEQSNIGIVIERLAEVAFAPSRIVRLGFMVLGSLLFLTAFVAAARIAHISTAQHAAIHPLNRYEVTGELGSGGMGVVYRARHRQLGRDVALKVLGDRRTRQDRLRFDREARLAASLSNPHSVMIYDYGRSEDGEAFCVMELLKGLTLQEVVMRSGPQPIGRVLFIIRQICDALAEAHGMNLLHRDIKPQNVMLSLDAAVGDWAVVFDYGLAKPFEPAADIYQTSETTWSGTPMYMAPERYREPTAMDPRSDLYSVGCIAYFLLSGQAPFVDCDAASLFALILNEEPVSPSRHRQDAVPEPVECMIRKCMAKNAEDRFDSVQKLSEVIDQLRTQHPWTVAEARAWWQRYGDEQT